MLKMNQMNKLHFIGHKVDTWLENRAAVIDRG